MKTVYLHVGMPKCASSTLQSFFHCNDTLHRSEGLCYPLSYREKAGYFSHRPLHHLSLSEVAGAVDEIADEAADASCDRILISSEEFVNSLWDRDITGYIIDALNARFGLKNVRILVLFRNPFPFAESVFAQFLKGGMFRTPESFLKSRSNGIIGFSTDFRVRNGFDFFSYTAFVERLRFYAPYNSFEMLSTERADWQGADILEVLCQRLKVSKGEPNVSSNERYSGTALHLMHHARKLYGLRRTKARRSLISALFPKQEHQFSKLLHVHGELFDQIAASAERDRKYFDRHSKELSTELFAIPDHYRYQREQEDQLIISEWQLKFIERVITREEISLPLARRMKSNMQRKARQASSNE